MTLLAVYFIIILDYRNDVRQRANSSNFFEFRMGRKAAETARHINITMHLAQELLRTVQWWFKKFCKRDESLEDAEHSGRPSEGDNQLRVSLKLIVLKLHEKLLKNSLLTILQLFGIWSKLERWKSSVSGCLISWLKIKKIIFLKCLLLFYATMNHFLIRLWLLTKSVFYTTTSNDQLGGWTEKKLQGTSKSKLAPEKVMVTIWWSVACLIHNSFLNPGKTITSEKYAQQIDEMHWKLQHLQLALVNRNGPVPHDSAWMHVI